MTPLILTHPPFILSLSKDRTSQRTLSLSKCAREAGQSEAQHLLGGQT
jgi:hypothetical protein